MTTTCCGGGSCAPAPVTNVINVSGPPITSVADLEAFAADLAALSTDPADEADTSPEAVAARFADPERRAEAELAIGEFLRALGIPQDAEHVAETPKRVAKAFRELLAGYAEDPRVHLHRQFPGPADAGVVVVQGVQFTSLCAHHLLPFTGRATVAYLPGAGEPIVGLSKLARVVEGYARRLQTQEVLGSQVADALEETLAPLGAACIVTSQHNCMAIRGVRQRTAVMTTSSLRGVFRTDTAARAELMALHEVALR